MATVTGASRFRVALAVASSSPITVTGASVFAVTFRVRSSARQPTGLVPAQPVDLGPLEGFAS